MAINGTAVPHIVWDWNGTLLDDNHAVLASVNSVCTEFGRPSITLEHWRSIFRRPLTACYEQLLGQSLSPEQWATVDVRYHSKYRTLLGTCGLADGAKDALRGWHTRGGTQSLLSMWFHDELRSLVDAFGLTGYFTRLDGLRAAVGGGSKARHLVEHLAAQRLDPSRVVVLGDVPDDAAAAAAAGTQCVLLTTGVASRGALQRTGAPVANSIAEAVALIDG